MTISKDTEKACEKIQHIFVIKTLNKVGREEKVFILGEGVLSAKSPSGGRLSALLLSSGRRQGCPLSPRLPHSVLKVRANPVKEGKSSETSDWKGGRIQR